MADFVFLAQRPHKVRRDGGLRVGLLDLGDYFVYGSHSCDCIHYFCFSVFIIYGAAPRNLALHLFIFVTLLLVTLFFVALLFVTFTFIRHGVYGQPESAAFRKYNFQRTTERFRVLIVSIFSKINQDFLIVFQNF
ncbi:MAG: hypothetical protein FWD49_03800 [Firmicutes bacterium]|nr:hypothetical protein [Bacillota bacterium]